MQRNRMRLLLGGGALVALCAAGCTGDVAERAGSPSVPTFPSPGPPSGPITVSPPPPSSPESPPANPEPEPAPAPVPAPTPAPAPSGECKAAELELSIGRGDAAAGTHYRPLRFTNKGGRSCVIQGFPGVSYVAGDDGHQVGPAAFREGAKGAPITLAPGQTAFATVGFVQVRNFDEAVCKPTAVRGLRIYPPHDTAAMFLPLEGTGCAGDPPGHQLTVRTVDNGDGGV